LVHKRKRSLDYTKDLKSVSGVFDEKTRLSLYRLLNKKQIQIQSLIKEGKESVVFSGLTQEKKWVIIKVYRTQVMDFKKISKYLLGDPRFGKISKNRRDFIYTWCRREYKNLQTASRAGVNCPEPITSSDNILIMSFIGDESTVAPRLIDVRLENPKEIYKMVVENMKKLSKAGLAHGDLSAYNILFKNGPVFIDLSHSTTSKSSIFLELLRRDIENINSYFTKLDIRVIDSEKLYKDLIKLLRIK